MAKVEDEIKIYHPEGHVYILLTNDEGTYEVDLMKEEGIDDSLSDIASWNFDENMNRAGLFLCTLATFIDQQQYPNVEHLFMGGARWNTPTEMDERISIASSLDNEDILEITHHPDCCDSYRKGIQMTPEEINEFFKIERHIICNESICLGEGNFADPIHYLSIDDVLKTIGFSLYMPKNRSSSYVDLDDPSEEQLLIEIFEEAHALYRTTVAEIKAMIEDEELEL